MALLFVVGALLVGVLAVPAAVDARAPPQAACGVCTDALDDAAGDRGVALERASSEMTIRVDGNGSAAWTARVALAEGADALRDNSVREAVVADARHGTLADPDAVRSRMEGDTLVVSYRTDDDAEREAGVLLFTGFHATGPTMPFAMGGPGPAYPGADELTLRGPPNTAVEGEYDGAANGGAEVRWTDADADVDRSTVVAFAPEEARFAGVRTRLARLLFRL
ncbi:hypothetical protein HUG12_17510 [Halorarum salinum]|uniref:Uncharacterized protein n=1 Tax=Halorarum salinum TaxID=2743089 RepID=A0A7D5QGI9_9EURY|nr:hypothetical protein HUG12_17510 [Halobaculum salinum]